MFKKNIAALACSCSLFAFSGQASAVDDCVTALDYFSPSTCEVQASGATVLRASIIKPTGSTAPSTIPEATDSLDELIIAVNGWAASQSMVDLFIDGVEDIADSTNVNVLAVTYDLSSTDTIESLSESFQKLLTDLHGNRNMGSPQLVVAGYSLGGVIARYTLRDMEMNGLDHNTSLYISYESPHRGAYIPQSIQNIPTMYQFGNDTMQTVVDSLSSGPVKVQLTVMGEEINQAKVDANQKIIDDLLGVTFTSAVAKQILIDNVHSDGSDFSTFFTKYEQMGLPVQTQRNIAITNGNMNGDGLPPWSLSGNNYYHFQGRIGSTTLVNDGDAWAQANFQLKPTVAGQANIFAGVNGQRYDWLFGGLVKNTAAIGASKTYTTPAGSKEYDLVPGGHMSFNTELNAKSDDFEALSDYVVVRHDSTNVFSFVPTYSALDIDMSYDYSAAVDAAYSNFAAVDLFSMSSQFAPDDNGPHTAFSPSAAIYTLVTDTLSQLTPADKLVLWLSDANTIPDCIECKDDRDYRDIVSCDYNTFAGCLTVGRRGDGDADYYGYDLYYHALDYGYDSISAMFDARFPPDPTYTTDEIIIEFLQHVMSLPSTYWDSITKAKCESMDIYDQHQYICDKIN